jgi:hypothetical protein
LELDAASTLLGVRFVFFSFSISKKTRGKKTISKGILKQNLEKKAKASKQAKSASGERRSKHALRRSTLGVHGQVCQRLVSVEVEWATNARRAGVGESGDESSFDRKKTRRRRRRRRWLFFSTSDHLSLIPHQTNKKNRALYQLQLVPLAEAKKHIPPEFHIVSLFG